MEGTGSNVDYVKLITVSLHLNIQVPGHYPYSTNVILTLMLCLRK